MQRVIPAVVLSVFAVLAVGCLPSPLGGTSEAWAAGCTPTSGQQSGVDVGETGGPINFASVEASGVTFVYARAAQGNYYTDPRYSTYDTQANAAGLAFGAYQVFDPSVDPTAQANYFLSAANVTAGDLVPMLDVVDDGHGGPSDAGGGVTTAVFTSRLQTWLNVVQSALGVRPLLYADTSEWDTFTGSDMAFGMAGYPLWIAYVGALSPPPLPGGWTTWAFWAHSFTGSVSGITGDVDEDYFDGAVDGGNLCALTVSSQQTAAPANTVLPQISGTPAVGQTLACSQGSWTNFPGSFGYQWLRDGAAIPTATSAGYTVTGADAGHQLSCQVTATNGADGTNATSAAVAVPVVALGPGTGAPPVQTPSSPPGRSSSPTAVKLVAKTINTILPDLTCVDRRKFTFPVTQSRSGNGNVISAVVYLNGKKTKTVTGNNIRSVSITKLPRKTFLVKVVTITTKHLEITSSRRYVGCRKGQRSDLKTKTK